MDDLLGGTAAWPQSEGEPGDCQDPAAMARVRSQPHLVGSTAASATGSALVSALATGAYKASPRPPKSGDMVVAVGDPGIGSLDLKLHNFPSVSFHPDTGEVDHSGERKLRTGEVAGGSEHATDWSSVAGSDVKERASGGLKSKTRLPKESRGTRVVSFGEPSGEGGGANSQEEVPKPGGPVFTIGDGAGPLVVLAAGPVAGACAHTPPMLPPLPLAGISGMPSAPPPGWPALHDGEGPRQEVIDCCRDAAYRPSSSEARRSSDVHIMSLSGGGRPMSSGGSPLGSEVHIMSLSGGIPMSGGGGRPMSGGSPRSAHMLQQLQPLSAASASLDVTESGASGGYLSVPGVDVSGPLTTPRASSPAHLQPEASFISVSPPGSANLVLRSSANAVRLVNGSGRFSPRGTSPLGQPLLSPSP